MELKKVSLWLFFCLFLILPEYFALEFSASLPLLTASRFIIILLLVNLFLMGRIRIRIDRSYLTFFLILLIVNIYHISTNSSEAIKAVFSLVIEETVLYIALKNLITSKSMLIKGIDIMVKTSGVISLLAIFEAYTKINIFYFLTTTSRDMLQASYDRLGVLRAEASFGHPVYFAVYLCCLLPFSLYFFENTKKRIYAIVAILNITAVFCSGTRGGIVTLVVLLLWSVFSKRDKVKFKYLKAVLGGLPILIVIFILYPQVFNYASSLFISILASLGFSSTDILNFGGNASGITSRLAQFTGLTWAKEHGALIMGFGPGAHKHGLISFVNVISGAWNVTTSIDIGYLSNILLYGIVGALGYAILYVSVIRKVLKYSNEKQTDNLFNAFKYFYIAYFVSLVSSVGQTATFFVFTFLMLIYIDLDRRGHVDEKQIDSRVIRYRT